MKFAELIKNMNLKQRRLLQESVKKRLLQEDNGADNVLSAPVGSSLKKGDKEIFRKTQQGWKTTVRLTQDQVLSLVKAESRDTVRKGLEKLGQGDEYPIMKGSLVDPEVAGDKGEITFQREGDLFADPRVVPDEVIKSFARSLNLSAGSQETSEGDFSIGDAVVKIEGDVITISVGDDGSGTYRGFEDIFGAGSGIAVKIQKAAGSKNPNVLIFSLSDATEASVLRKISKSVLRGMGIGKVKFTREKIGKPYVAKIAGASRAKGVLGDLAAMLVDKQAGGMVRTVKPVDDQRPSEPVPPRQKKSKKPDLEEKLSQLPVGTKLYMNIAGEKVEFAEVTAGEYPFQGTMSIAPEDLYRDLKPEARSRAEKIVSDKAGVLETTASDYKDDVVVVGSGESNKIYYNFIDGKFKDATAYTVEEMAKSIRLTKEKYPDIKIIKEEPV